MAKAKTTQTSNLNYEAGGVAFLGCIVAGAGLGFVFDQLLPGTVIGVGVGFLIMAVMAQMSSKKK